MGRKCDVLAGEVAKCDARTIVVKTGDGFLWILFRSHCDGYTDVRLGERVRFVYQDNGRAVLTQAAGG